MLSSSGDPNKGTARERDYDRLTSQSLSFLHQTPGLVHIRGNPDSPSFFWGDHLHILYAFGPTGIYDCVRITLYVRKAIGC